MRYFNDHFKSCQSKKFIIVFKMHLWKRWFLSKCAISNSRVTLSYRAYKVLDFHKNWSRHFNYQNKLTRVSGFFWISRWNKMACAKSSLAHVVWKNCVRYASEKVIFSPSLRSSANVPTRIKSLFRTCIKYNYSLRILKKVFLQLF